MFVWPGCDNKKEAPVPRQSRRTDTSVHFLNNSQVLHVISFYQILYEPCLSLTRSQL